MSKTLVNILYDSYPIANYLFDKTMYEPGDKLLFVTQHHQQKEIGKLQRLLQLSPDDVRSIILEYSGDEYVWDKMCRTIRKELNDKECYHVNLAGGTRFMALSVQRVFSEFNSEFYYIPFGYNFIAHSKIDNNNDDNDDEFIPISYRMTVKEFMTLRGIEMSDGELPIKDADYTRSRFYRCVYEGMSSREKEILSILRQQYRKRKFVKFDELVHPSNPKIDPIKDIRNYIKDIGFYTETPGQLNMEEIVYLTGGWFEELVYNWVKENANPDDVVLTVHIARPEATFQNELDVAFTKNNHLFVVECKTGIGGEGMFHDIVYKVCALKEAHLGEACHSFIVSMIKDENGQLAKTAKNMDVIFGDYSKMSSPNQRKHLLKEVDRLCHAK